MKTVLLIVAFASLTTLSNAADLAFDSVVGYTNPWNASNPQNLGTDFAGWRFETYAGPDASTFIDSSLPAWSITIPQDSNGNAS
jgi:hypothetical protein